MSQVLAELFPAEVELPDGRFLRKAKVYLTDDGIAVLMQVGKTVELAFGGRHETPPLLPDMRAPTRARLAEVHTSAGTVKARGVYGCACDTRELQRFSYDDVQRLATANEPV